MGRGSVALGAFTLRAFPVRLAVNSQNQSTNPTL